MNKAKFSDVVDESQPAQELERLRALFDGIDEVIYVADPETYEVLFVNKKIEGMFGKHIIGRKCYAVFQNLTKPCPFCTNKHIFGKNLGRTYTWEFQNQRNQQWYKCIDKAIKWNGGKHVRYEMAIDITNQKKMKAELHENEQFFRYVVKNSVHAILVLDDNFRIINFNKEAERISGYSEKEIVGQDFRRFLADESKALVQERYLRRQRGEKVPKVYEFKIVRKSGEEAYVEIKSEVMQYQCGRICTIVQMLDVNDRKKVEEERKRSEERLSALNVYGQNLNLAKNLREIYEQTLDAMEKTLGFEYASILMLEGKKLCLVANRGYFRKLSLKLPLDRNKGITVRAVKKGVSVFVPDTSKDKGYVRGVKDIRSELAVPIKVGNDVLGVLNVESRRVAAFDENDRKLLEILASHAAIAITNLGRQVRLSALNEYGKNLNMAANLNRICRLTLNAMEKTLGFEFATFFVVEGRKLRLAAHRGYPRKFTIIMGLDGNKGVSVKAARISKPIFVRDVRKEKAYVSGRPGMLSELAVPIKAEDKVLGVLNVESERLDAFDGNDRELLEILASHAATAMNNLARRDQQRKLARGLEYLIKSAVEVMHAKNMHQKLRVIAKTIQKFGWRRVVVRLRDENFEMTGFATAGLTSAERKFLLKRGASRQIWKGLFGPNFEKYRIGQFYYLPWNDPWVRKNIHKLSAGADSKKTATCAGVLSRRSPEEMVDWHPQDMLYAPLSTPEGRIVGTVSMDDPSDGQKPNMLSLTPLELFLPKVAIIIENAQLIENLRDARKQLETYATVLEQKVEERTHELKVSQEQLLKAQRLGVIGELAGMVGHDLRNPLTSIAGATYYMKKRLVPKNDGKIEEMLELIEKNIAYSNKIINDLLDYSREIKPDITETTPALLVKESLTLVDMPKKVQLVDLTMNEPRIKVDVEKMKRAFVNIMKNAVDAMPRGGKLTIECIRQNDDLKFLFCDTGVGMSKETVTKIWTPLFTTKAKGMGFGLPICKRIVEAHEGCISVASALRKGTTFTITLPIEPKIKEGGEEVWVKTPESLSLTTTKT